MPQLKGCIHHSSYQLVLKPQNVPNALYNMKIRNQKVHCQGSIS